MQILLSLPPRMAAAFERLEGRCRPGWFATSDPEGARVGSGGGTAHLLAEAWRAANLEGVSFADWLTREPRLLIHAGGQGRRLPAYAPLGKSLVPIPASRWARGQRLDQTLLDLQLPAYSRVLAVADPAHVVLVTSGDVLLEFAPRLPRLPAADVVGLGMWVPAEKARQFGVFFAERRNPNDIAFFLQKPSAARIRELAGDYLPLVDTGMWLLSARAVEVLMRRCGWEGGAFTGGGVAPYELYAEFGLALGRKPTVVDPEISRLTCAVVALPEARFHHFGTSRQLIESVSALQNQELDEVRLGVTGVKRHPDLYLLNSRFELPIGLDRNHTLWVENSSIPRTWELQSEHVLTGVPPNDWRVRLEPRVCLDFVPVGGGATCIRAYGIDDAFRGAVGEEGTQWFGAPVARWFARRSLDFASAGLDPGTDLQQAALFPVLALTGMEAGFLEWLWAAEPVANAAFTARWRQARRLSAEQIGAEVDLGRIYRQRAENRRLCLRPMLRNYRWSVIFRLDLDSTARLLAETEEPLPDLDIPADDTVEPLHRVHEPMLRSAVERHRGLPGWEEHERIAFDRLREMIIRQAQLELVLPRCNVLEDQIVWGRSPVRLDLAGGWTDTPPYCLEFGGQVVNVAVDLNGQQPIQVFCRLSAKPELVLRSIDLGVEERVRTYAELDTFAQAGSEFALGKAALALAGFLPRFHAQGGHASLEEQLRAFGGGLELSMLSAVPKGSGLGTSSILAATLLATLGEICGLDWDKRGLFLRTMAMEQMLTTGGGWQDQAGAIFRGIKLVETAAGLAQQAAIHWLPSHLFERRYANTQILLYYTGITRMAKSILREIVRGIFLNSPTHLATLAEIGANARRASAALQQCDYDALTDVIRRSWELNQRLDPGTNPPEVQRILSQVGGDLAAAKLLGAGGGGFFLMFAKDEAAALRIRNSLTHAPPNPRARFVDFALSETGLQVTRS